MSKHPEFTDEEQLLVRTELECVYDERVKQQTKWGEQNWPDGTGGNELEAMANLAKFNCDQAAKNGKLTFKHILEEETLEAFAETDEEALCMELTQVAAVAVAWIESIKRRQKLRAAAQEK